MTADLEWIWLLDATELAREYLTSGDPDVRDEAYARALDTASMNYGGLFEQWLVAAINLSVETNGAGSIGAGPLEAALERSPQLIPILEASCDAACLDACLSHMWLDDAVEPVTRWIQERLRVGPEYNGHVDRS